MRDELDGDLLQLFEEKNLELPDEPFRAELRLRIEKSRIGYSRIYWILTALVLAVCAVLTPLVINRVSLLCVELAGGLQYVAKFLATPAGWAVLAAATLLPFAFSRRVLYLFE